MLTANNKRIPHIILSLLLSLTLTVTATFAPVFAEGDIQLNDPAVTYVETADESHESIHTEWDCIWFGNYYQDNSQTKKPIKWRVLSVNGNDAFILSDQVIDGGLYDSDPPLSNYIEYSSWDDCTLREYLNSDFLTEAFSESDQQAIMTTTVSTPNNPEQNSTGGRNTQDKIYLLSIQEACNPEYGFNETFAMSSDTRAAVNTPYAQTKGAAGGSSVSGDPATAGFWALRSPGRYPEYPYSVPTGRSGYCAIVYTDEGLGNYYGKLVRYDKIGIRPCMHIDLSAADWTYAGTVSGGADAVTEPDEPITAEQKTASGILNERGGCKALWTVDYYEESTGRKYDGELRITVDGSDSSVGTILTDNGNGDPSPWLTATGMDPENIDRIKVTGTDVNPLSITENQFKGYTAVRRIVLTNVESIQDSAFEGCTSLKEVDGLGEELTWIGARAFKNCTSLTDVCQYRYKNEGWYEVKYTYSPKKLTSIGTEAFSGDSQLGDFWLYDEVYEIGTDAFSGCSNLMLHVNKDSYAESYADDNSIPYDFILLSDFDVMKDGWSFSNSSSVFGNSSKYYISDADMQKYTPRQREIVKNEQSAWGGSCFGMSSVAVLSKMGLILPSSIQDGKNTLYSINPPHNDKVESLINFFQFQQCFPAFMSEKIKTSRMSEKERISNIQRCAEEANTSGQPFVLDYFWPSENAEQKYKGHTVVGYGLEHGEYEVARSDSLIFKNKYDSRVLLYNCNHPGQTEYLYFNEGTAEWIMPKARQATVIGVATSDRRVLDSAQYGIEEEHFFKSFIYNSTDPGIHLSYNGESYNITGPGSYADGEIIAFIPSGDAAASDEDTEFLSETLIVTVPEDADCAISPISNTSGVLMYNTDDRLISLDCSGFGTAEFSGSCSIDLTGVTGDCTLKLIQDTPSDSLGWNVTEFSGSGLDGTLSMTEQASGVILSGSELGKLSIGVSDETTTESISLATDESAVMLRGTIGDAKVYADPDGDGEFDEEIASGTAVEPIVTLTDINTLTISGIAGKKYTGKSLTQNIVIEDAGKVLESGTDYEVRYQNNINAGKATMIITGKGSYTGTVTRTFTISKASNTLSIKAKKPTLKYTKIRKKAQTLAATKLITFSKKGVGKYKYSITSAKKGKKSYKKYFKINSATGKVTIKKGLKKGTYSVSLKLTAAGDKNHNQIIKTITVKVKVK